MTPPATTDTPVDVAIIGASFAGLNAARDRVGGRSRPGELNGVTIDTGGQWVGAGHERLTRAR